MQIGHFWHQLFRQKKLQSGGVCFLARTEHPPCVYFLQPSFLARIEHPPCVCNCVQL